jgi:hypothetical protein
MKRPNAAKRAKLAFVLIDPMTRECDVLLDDQVIGRVRRVEPFSVNPLPRRRVRGWMITDPDDADDIVWPTRRNAANALRRLHQALAADDGTAGSD